MKKILLLFTVLSVSVVTSACINNIAVRELNNKAADYMNKGDAESAVCRLKSSLELDNELFQTHYNLAVAYNSLGKYEEAVTELNKVLELNPEFIDAVYTLAVAKEALAYEIIKEAKEGDGLRSLSPQQMEDYNNRAQEVVDLYNKYLTDKKNAQDADIVNAKISELNEQIKELTDIYEANYTAVKSDSSINENTQNTENVQENTDNSEQ